MLPRTCRGLCLGPCCLLRLELSNPIDRFVVDEPFHAGIRIKMQKRGKLGRIEI
ncbi:hypothetical protein D3C87_1952240 [compost metagenome]